MAVDHGLGGRDNERSRKRRERKAKRLKTLTKKLRTPDLGHSPKEVKFDDEARKAFLTGFRKRKLERRKYGIAMQILKEQKLRKEALKEKREVMMNLNNDVPTFEDEEVDGDDSSPTNSQEQTFSDDATVSMFGSAVSVQISNDIGTSAKNSYLQSLNDSDDEDDNDDNDNRSVVSKASVRSSVSKSSVRNKNEPSRFEKAMKKAAQIASTKKKRVDIKSKNLKKEVKNKIESSKLLKRAMGKVFSKKGKKR